MPTALNCTFRSWCCQVDLLIIFANGELELICCCCCCQLSVSDWPSIWLIVTLLTRIVHSFMCLLSNFSVVLYRGERSHSYFLLTKAYEFKWLRTKSCNHRHHHQHLLSLLLYNFNVLQIATSIANSPARVNPFSFDLHLLTLSVNCRFTGASHEGSKAWGCMYVCLSVCLFLFFFLFFFSFAKRLNDWIVWAERFILCRVGKFIEANHSKSLW